MILCLKRSSNSLRACPLNRNSRCLHQLSRIFIPSGSVTTTPIDKGGGGKGHDLLVKAGMIRKSSSGVFSILPMGQFVVDKLERQIDQCMHKLGACKLSLPTLSPKSLWVESGRWESSGKELFKLQDRKSAEFCLSPTHEESITKIVAAEVNGYKQLPIRVYQVGRKYRDEMRPRGGMLRGKEFLMKDLYTFDDGIEAAHNTYKLVKSAYNELFRAMELPILVAEADSGNIGGELSHEYHLPATIGEDTLLKCSSCDYTANRELALTQVSKLMAEQSSTTVRFSHQIFRDTVFFDVCIPRGRKVNTMQALRQAQKVDKSVTELLPMPGEYTDVVNPRVTVHALESERLLEVNPGDACPRCDAGQLHDVQAIEIGHTFHLGTKYSEALNFKYTNINNKPTFPEMGCHGIGLSRLIAALAEIKSDEFGLNWPPQIAPFENILVVQSGLESVAMDIAQHIEYGFDAIDDRSGKSVGYKVKELQQLGIPNIVVLSKRFVQNNGHFKVDEKVQDIHSLVVEHVQARGDSERLWHKLTLLEWHTRSQARKSAQA